MRRSRQSNKRRLNKQRRRRRPRLRRNKQETALQLKLREDKQRQRNKQRLKRRLRRRRNERQMVPLYPSDKIPESVRWRPATPGTRSDRPKVLHRS